MSEGPLPPVPPIFSFLDRRKPTGEGRSAGLLLVIAIGLGGAVVAFFWEQHSRQWIHAVEIAFLPDDAAAAEAYVQAELEAVKARAADPSTAGATTTSRGDAAGSGSRTSGSPRP